MLSAPLRNQGSVRAPIRLPPIAWLVILGARVAFGIVLGPALLAPRVRRWLPWPSNGVAAGAFGFVCCSAAVALGGPAWNSTDGGLGIHVVPLLFMWAAAAFTWVELGWVGTLVGLVFAALWGTRLAALTPCDDVWPNVNGAYGVAVGMAVIAPTFAWLGRKTPARWRPLETPNRDVLSGAVGLRCDRPRGAPPASCPPADG